MDNSIMLFGESFEGNYSIKASKTNDIIFQGKNRIPVMELKKSLTFCVQNIDIRPRIYLNNRSLLKIRNIKGNE